MMKKYGIYFMLSSVLFLSCSSNTKNNKESSFSKNRIEQNKDENKPKEWLISVFKCDDANAFCFPEQEDVICTKQFLNFLEDSNEIHGPTNLNEQELIVAEKKYKKKWTSIYPLYTEENWLFGRGNGDIAALKEVLVDAISDMKYKVYIDYDGVNKTINEVTLVPSGSTYKIDYCSTKYID